jgi:hypothetical protein
MARFDSKTELSLQLLKQLYVEERLSIKEVANRFGCGETTVGRALRAQGIAIRNKHDYRLEMSRAELERLYCDEELTEDAIGRVFGCNGRTVGRRLEEYGIPRRPTGSAPKYAVPPEVLLSWSADLAYAIGLLTADGNLNKDRSRVEFISTDTDLIDLYCRALRLGDIHVVFTPQQSRQSWYQVKLSDRDFRAFIEEVGLTPAKSKTLGPLRVPDPVFRDFLRGVLDGDGSWYIAPSWSGRYRYLRVELCSASLDFLEWMTGRIEQLSGLRGHLQKKAGREAYNLLFIGQKARELGNYVYYSDEVLALPRKRRVWQQMQGHNQN